MAARKSLQRSAHAKKSQSKLAVNRSGNPVAEHGATPLFTATVRQKSLPSFFETDDILEAVACANPDYFEYKGTGNATDHTKPSCLAEPEPRAAFQSNNSNKAVTAVQKRPSADEQTQQNSAKLGDTDVMKTWTSQKDRFRHTFEDNQGREICFAIRQMEDDCEHIESTLVSAHKRKVMLLYHLKYLGRMLRKNCVQSKHAVKMEESIADLIRAMSSAQNSMMHETTVINIGVRSHLHEMQGHLWKKLGLTQYKPKSTTDHSNIPSSVHKTPMDVKRIVPQMEKVRMLLNPANFLTIANKPNGLLLAQHYIINYLKHCSDNHSWMQELKINFPTAHGSSEIMQLRDVPVFSEDTTTLFSGLKAAAEPLEILQEQFPGTEFSTGKEELEPITSLFNPDTLKHDPQQPHPSNLLQTIQLEIPNSIRKKGQTSDLLSFDEFAARHMDLFQFIEPPHVSPNRRSTVPWEGKAKALAADSFNTASGSNLQMSKSHREGTPTSHPSAAVLSGISASHTHLMAAEKD